MGKVDENKKQKKLALLNTAYELFTTKGINSTAISDIVKQAGVAKGTFYLYFKDKYDIRNKLIEKTSKRLFSDAISALNKVYIDNFDDQVIFIINHVIDSLTNDKILLKFMTFGHFLFWDIAISVLLVIIINMRWIKWVK